MAKLFSKCNTLDVHGAKIPDVVSSTFKLSLWSFRTQFICLIRMLFFEFIFIINGLLPGSMLGGYYAIVGIGLALTFGIMRLVNLAHGDFLVAAAYMSVVMLNFIPISPFLTLAFVMPVMVCIGYLLQRFILNRVSVQAVEKHNLSSAMGVISPLLVTFGLSIVIGHALFAVFSMDTAIIRNELSFSAIPLTKDLRIPALRLFSFCLAIGIMLTLHPFLRKTNFGRAIRSGRMMRG